MCLKLASFENFLYTILIINHEDVIMLECGGTFFLKQKLSL